MVKHTSLILTCILLAVGMVVGCKPKSPTTPSASGDGYFQTPFQTEAQFVVEAIVSDLAEQMVYAASHQLPDEKNFSVTATEAAGSSIDKPTYDLKVQLDAKKTLTTKITIDGPIWSPQVYQDVAKELAHIVDQKPTAAAAPRTKDTKLLSELAEVTADTIEKENEALSGSLEADFSDPDLHEKAALLLGAFLLRDHSGNFFEIRSPLSRITAHLSLAYYLRDNHTLSLNGQMAEAMLLTLIGNEAAALKQLDLIGTNETDVTPWVRALQARNTGNFLPLDKRNGLSRIESVTWFYAMADYVDPTQAWDKLSEAQKQTVDFVRAANDLKYSVEIGHQLLATAIPLELQEIGKVYELSHQQKLTKAELVPALNELPDRCFSRRNGEIHVQVIGWGQWANFLQRHLCHAVQQNFRFMNNMWGVPDEAKEFANQCEQSFNGLRLYPFVRRFNSTTEKDYHQSVDDSFKLTVAMPHLIPARCWNYLCATPKFAPAYRPVPNPHINEWHNHNPLPGTVYDLHPRLIQPSLVSRENNGLAQFETLHAIAPYDCRVTDYILEKKFNSKPNYEQAMAYYENMLPYSLCALRTVAGAVDDQPDRYEKLMLRACELDPACYYDLGDYFLARKQVTKAAQYIDQACAGDLDSIRVASRATWRVRHCLKKGEIEKARQIADFAAEVYSYNGLEAKAIFLEATTNYNGAFEYYGKIQERYSDAEPLIFFCQRYQLKTGNHQFDSALRQHIKFLFPRGLEPVSLQSFKNPPTDGVVIKGQSDRLTAAGLKNGDVIVAVYGIRVHTVKQYNYGRGLKNTAELDLIVWQGDAYREVKPSPPEHRFGVDLVNFGSQ